MFDSHAHSGKSNNNALICTSDPNEYELIKNCRYRAAGCLPGHEFSYEKMSDAASEGFHIGEVGLDRRFPDIENQKNVFIRSIEIASKYGRNLIVHSVGMIQLTFDILSSNSVPFIMHSYSSSYEMALRFIDLGGIISLSPRAEKLRDFGKLITLPFVTETDMPTGKEQMGTLLEWNDKLSSILGIDISKRSEEIMLKWLS